MSVIPERPTIVPPDAEGEAPRSEPSSSNSSPKLQEGVVSPPSVDTTSTESEGRARGLRKNCASDRVALATTLSGQRHTRVVLNPPPSRGGGGNYNNNNSSNVYGGNSNNNNSNAANASNSNAAHSNTGGSTVLRYRTDLDKAVIHFVFERMARAEEIVVVPDGESDKYEHSGLGDWHFFWMSVVRMRNIFSTADFRLQDNQIINHFPNHYELTRKDLMYKNIKRYLREHAQDRTLVLTLATNWQTAAAAATAGGRPLPEDMPGVKTYNFADGVPITYNIPNDLSMFIEEFKKHPGATWIVKPTARSQGKGIFLINRIQQLMRWAKEKKEAESIGATSASSPLFQPAPLPGSPGFNNPYPANSGLEKDVQNMLGAFIVSRYIANPLLIGGKKFDLRLYVLVTSYKPLVVYLHEEGFARFCATKYAGNSLSEDDLGSHLTNVALQKGDDNYNTTHGGKWSVKNLFLYLQGRYGAYVVEGLRASIEFLIFHSLQAMGKVLFNDKHSFELYGYDILIDEHIRPHLIEVNASPSLSTTTTSDRLLKEQVLTDTMKVVLPPGFPSTRAMPYWEYRTRTDLTTQLKTGFKILHF